MTLTVFNSFEKMVEEKKVISHQNLTIIGVHFSPKIALLDLCCALADIIQNSSHQ